MHSKATAPKAYWRAVDAVAPGFSDLFMSAIAGDVAALARLGKITCPTTDPPPTLQ